MPQGKQSTFIYTPFNRFKNCRRYPALTPFVVNPHQKRAQFSHKALKTREDKLAWKITHTGKTNQASLTGKQQCKKKLLEKNEQTGNQSTRRRARHMRARLRPHEPDRWKGVVYMKKKNTHTHTKTRRGHSSELHVRAPRTKEYITTRRGVESITKHVTKLHLFYSINPKSHRKV